MVWIGRLETNQCGQSNDDTEGKGGRDEESNRRDRSHETLQNNDGMISDAPCPSSRLPFVARMGNHQTTQNARRLDFCQPPSSHPAALSLSSKIPKQRRLPTGCRASVHT